jgi:hypothetical protein
VVEQRTTPLCVHVLSILLRAWDGALWRAGAGRAEANWRIIISHLNANERGSAIS